MPPLIKNIFTMKEVVIVSAVRTPMGSWGGSLKGFSATQLGAIAIKGALDKAGVELKEVTDVYMGSVLQANLGQAPARQAAKFAGLADNVNATTINKVCASGLKAITMAAQAIMCGDAEVVVAGGMESMSNVPFYAPSVRWGNKFGDTAMIDGIAKDGLVDVYHNYAMGNAAENTAAEMNFSREAQDAFAVQSYTRAQNSVNEGKFDAEIVPVEVPQRKGDPIVFSKDEEPFNVKFDKISSLRSAFLKDGSVTAANSSTMNDGASALILMSKEKAAALGLKPLAVIRAYADFEQAPEWFTTAPTGSVNKALAKAGLTIDQVDFVELNEAFSVVGLANCELLKLPAEKVNVYGGAVSMGHPLGSSGSRIVVTLLNILNQEKGKIGVASICNGGGGSTALIVEKL